jgi:hypothetical protein
MRVLFAFVTMSLFVAPAAAVAQHGGIAVAPAGSVPREVSQYDFLVGDWDLTVEVPPSSFAARIHGMPKLVGTWKARRALDGWGLEDDLRITDEAGNPAALLHSVRYYDRNVKHWVISSLDVYRGGFRTGSADWRGNFMLLGGNGTGPDGKPYVTRTRIYDITPTSFKFQQDRSDDGGKSWQEGTLKIAAKRVGSKSG